MLTNANVSTSTSISNSVKNSPAFTNDYNDDGVHVSNGDESIKLKHKNKVNVSTHIQTIVGNSSRNSGRLIKSFVETNAFLKSMEAQIARLLNKL